MYEHVQRSPLHLLLYLPAAGAFVVAWQIRTDVAPSIIVGVVAILLVLFALSFQTLTVADRNEHLAIRYGPLNLFGSRIAFRDITEVEQGKSSLIDGWGIHFIPFRGWTFNLWGFECVKVHVGKKVVRVGTNDSENLVTYLRERIAQSPSSDQPS